MNMSTQILHKSIILALVFWCQGLYAFNLFGSDDERLEEIQTQLDDLTTTVYNLEQLNAKLNNQSSLYEKRYSEIEEKLTNFEISSSEIKVELNNISRQFSSDKNNTAKSIKNINTKLTRVNREQKILSVSLDKKIDDLSDKQIMLREEKNETAQQLSKMQGYVLKIENIVSDRKIVVDDSITNVNREIALRSLYVAICILVFIVILVWFKRRLNVDKTRLTNEMVKARDILDVEYNSLDLKLSEILEKQINIDTLNKQDSLSDETVDIDHSLPLKVATEIHRMRKRIDSMADDTKGIKPLAKALERLEDSIGEQGYEVVNLLGEKYVEGMTVNLEFKLEENLGPSEKIISKVIKPQVNYKDVIVQVADIIVSTGE